MRVVSTLRCSHKTGIEMEALTAASVAALTVYDMCKGGGPRVCVLMRRCCCTRPAGKSGDYHAEGASAR